jgi:long-chain acyl-CoA synthetase
LTIARGIHAAAARAPEAVAIEAGESRLTYRQLAERIAKVASLMAHSHDVGQGDRVALVAANCLEYAELVVGIAEAGGIAVTLNPRLSADEMAAIIADCTPKLAILDGAAAGAFSGVLEGIVPSLTIGPQYEAALAATAIGVPPPPPEDSEPFALAYTSGTTGKPKGVVLSHRSREITFASMAAVYGCFEPGDRFLALAPMCHGAGFVFACAPLSHGATTVLFDGADAAAIVARLGEGDIDGVFMVPTHFARIFDLPGELLERSRTHRLRAIISNASALSYSLKQRIVAHFGEGLLHETYGSTEGGIVTDIGPGDILRKPTSVGLPFPEMEVELRKPDGTLAITGEPGELFCRGPTLFSGYWNRPEATAETLVDGWVTVGDIATRDTDGYITIVDRKKDMVITGGFNVYPREIEEVIAGLPGVRDVAVVGRPSREWGESLHAFVVAASDGGCSGETILAECRSRLAGFKVPKAVSFVGELPRNAGGKVLKTLLREVASG